MVLPRWEGAGLLSPAEQVNAPASPQVSGHCVTQRPRVTQAGVLTVTLSPMMLPQRVGGPLSVQCSSTAFTAAPERNRGEGNNPRQQGTSGPVGLSRPPTPSFPFSEVARGCASADYLTRISEGQVKE